MLTFTKDTIYDTVGAIITASQMCRQTKSPKGTRHRFLCKIYDKDAKVVREFTTIQKDVLKSICNDMYTLEEGSVECICHSHPQQYR